MGSSPTSGTEGEGCRSSPFKLYQLLLNHAKRHGWFASFTANRPPQRLVAQAQTSLRAEWMAPARAISRA